MKLEIINKSSRVKRDYRLNSNMQYEHFYDYFSSKLRSHDLLHVIDNSIELDSIDAKILKEQKFKVRGHVN